MGRWQERRRHASGFRPPDAAGFENPLGDALSLGRRRSEGRAGRARRLVLPEGPGAEAPRSARALQLLLEQRPRRPRARHPAKRHHDDGELRAASSERAHRELPGARAPSRQGHVDGGALPGWPASDAQPGDGLQLQLDEHVHLRRRCGAAASEGHDPSPGGVVRQHQGEQVESGSGSVGRLRRPDGGRDGPRVAQHHLLTTTTSSRRRSPSARRRRPRTRSSNSSKHETFDEAPLPPGSGASLLPFG